jgi:chromatin remodeling complex protein RSC6
VVLSFCHTLLMHFTTYYMRLIYNFALNHLNRSLKVMYKMSRAKKTVTSIPDVVEPVEEVKKSKKVEPVEEVKKSKKVEPVEEVKKSKKVDEVKKSKKMEPVEVKSDEKVLVSPVNEAVEPSPNASSDDTFTGEFSQILVQVQCLSQQLCALKGALRCLEKKAVREFKAANKANKHKRSKGNRKPSGFVKPTQISDELADFLAKSKGSEMARTEVTKEINAYIRANKLQDPVNGRKIIPDSKLSTLLNMKKDDELTYFNLQRYMSPHFAKSSSVKV